MPPPTLEDLAALDAAEQAAYAAFRDAVLADPVNVAWVDYQVARATRAEAAAQARAAQPANTSPIPVPPLDVGVKVSHAATIVGDLYLELVAGG